jgi:hypothetical protein
MTRGTDMSTDTMPRTLRQPPGRTMPPARTMPPGNTMPPGRTMPPARTMPPGNAMPPGRAAMPPGRAAAVPPGRGTVTPGRIVPPQRPEPGPARKPRTKAPRRADRARPNPDAPGRVAPGPPRPRLRPFTAPRHTRPVAASPAWPAGGLRPRPRHPRAPFILLLVGLLGGAMVSLLMISTTLAEGSFRISNLQQQNTNLARQEQVLSQQVAQAESPAQIAQEAEQFGMQQNPNLRFIDLKTGKIVSGKVSAADAQINVPGYTP